jgi:hypothetical protein
MKKPEKTTIIKHKLCIDYDETLQSVIDRIPPNISFDSVTIENEIGYYDSVEVCVKFNEIKTLSDNDYDLLLKKYNDYVLKNEQKAAKLARKNKLKVKNNA